MKKPANKQATVQITDAEIIQMQSRHLEKQQATTRSYILQVRQLNEQNRLLREENSQLRVLSQQEPGVPLEREAVSSTKVSRGSPIVITNIPAPAAGSNAPGSAEFEARNQARLLGQQEGRADAFAEVITDLLKGIFASSAKQV